MDAARGIQSTCVIDDGKPPSRFTTQVTYPQAELPLKICEQWLGRPFEELDHDGGELLNSQGRNLVNG